MKKRTFIPAMLSGLVIGLSGSSALAVTYDVYNDLSASEFMGEGEELAAALIGDGITYVDGSSAFQGRFDLGGFEGGFEGPFEGGFGDDFEGPFEDEFDGEVVVIIPSAPEPYGSSSIYTGLNVGTIEGTEFSLSDGILLTSGYAAPPSSNTAPDFTGIASGQGDEGLDALLAMAGSDEVTTDATVLSFDFTVDAGINAISLDFIFGTEVFPNFVGDSPDIAAVFIDGVNYAGFADGGLLTATRESVDGGNFHDNNAEAPLAIEYDGISKPLTLTGLLDTSLAQHSIKLAISDTGGTQFDAGIFAANLRGLTLGEVGGSGTSATDPLLPGPGSSGDSFEFIIDVGDAGHGIDPTQPIFIDPYVATGYVYEAVGGTFATAEVAGSYGDDLYDLFYWDGTEYQLALSDWNGDQFDFLAIDLLGVSQFLINGIEVSAGLDPEDETAFITGITFTSGGQITVTQTAIQTCDGASDCAQSGDIPEPGALLLFGAGLLGWRVVKRRT